MNRKYNLKLDLQFRCNNSTMKFNQFDNNTSDFFMRITNGGNLVDIEKAIVVLAIIKPSGKVASQFVEVKNGLVYADLKPSMKDEIGTYTAQAMLILEDERVVTDSISYKVEEDKIFSLLNDNVETTEEFTLLTDMLSRLSTIETNEEQRVINEAERILSEENRKIEEAKRVEAELIRQHEEADRAKYDATRESNENTRKQNESIRLANETNRIDEESKRVEEEANRVEAEQLRKDNYNFMTEDEERRRSEANAHREAEVLRVQAENTRVNEEAKRRTIEQARVLAENTRVSNENTRKANEETRQNNETHRVEAETQRQNRYNSFIADAEVNANNFENYTNSAKVKEEERKSNELNRKSQEDRRVSNEVERISNENARKANEVAREKNETSRQYVFENKVDEVDKKIIELNTTKDNFVSSVNTKVDTKISELDNAKSDMTNTVTNKIDEVENRFNALTSKQQQDAEVIDARDGETSLKARLDRDIEKAKQVYANVEGSSISTDSSVGYLKDVEILGNTIQDSENLADIRSVGDKVEGQELYEIPVLSRGKNLFIDAIYKKEDTNGWSPKIKIDKTKSYVCKYGSSVKTPYIRFFDENLKTIPLDETFSKSGRVIKNASYFSIQYVNSLTNIQLEEGTVATPYEPYVEDELTILSPVQLEKVGDVADKIIEKDGVFGVEKNIVTKICNASDSWYKIGTNSENYSLFATNIDDVKISSCVMSNRIPTHPEGAIYNSCNSFCIGTHNTPNVLRVSIESTKLTSDDIVGFKEWIKLGGDLLVKYITTQPTFITLPHDQQIKLRTFANKTNISFLTEIEGTIKAQVPKSLGATVNTHTEQINNLNKELDRVKKLEESTVSTVTTESDFTTVEATSNGYFEDVKLEGKTLVNLYQATESKHELGNVNANFNNGVVTLEGIGKEIIYRCLKDTLNVKSNTKYTLVLNVLETNYEGSLKNAYCGNRDKFSERLYLDFSKIGVSVYTFKTKEDFTDDVLWDLYIYFNNQTNATIKFEMMILEGDHTQNPPSYFEGLKSVGQSATTSEDGVDEIVVSSVNGNLFDVESYASHINSLNDGVSKVELDGTTLKSILIGTVGKNFFSFNRRGSFICTCEFVDATKWRVQSRTYDSGWTTSQSIKLPFGTYDELKVFSSENTSIKNIQIKVSETNSPYTPHQSDKKRLLYYNEETQTWEKPILRQGDSIEKHANGKYYYHQRSGEVVLNGSENWNNDANSSTISPATYRQSIQFNAIDIPSASFDTKTSPNIISDLLPTVIFGDVYSYNHVGISISGTDSVGTHIIINNNFTDVTELKQWLQANNLTLVYQLAEEKVYECTNIDLITYNGETNYIVESGVLSPKTTLKVHSNISNVVSLLQKKVSLLESNVKASQEVQDMMILETDMRMLDIELALMDFMPMKLNLGGSDMLRSATYFNFLKNHIVNETYEKEYLENVMNKYLATGRINQDEYNELYKMLYPPVYDIELPIEY